MEYIELLEYMKKELTKNGYKQKDLVGILDVTIVTAYRYWNGISEMPYRCIVELLQVIDKKIVVKKI